MKVQYQVRTVSRFVVTRYEESDDARTGASETRGEYDNADVAFEVAYALCKSEHDASDEDVGSMNFIYPTRVPDAA